MSPFEKQSSSEDKIEKAANKNEAIDREKKMNFAVDKIVLFTESYIKRDPEALKTMGIKKIVDVLSENVLNTLKEKGYKFTKDQEDEIKRLAFDILSTPSGSVVIKNEANDPKKNPQDNKASVEKSELKNFKQELSELREKYNLTDQFQQMDFLKALKRLDSDNNHKAVIREVVRVILLDMPISAPGKLDISMTRDLFPDLGHSAEVIAVDNKNITVEVHGVGRLIYSKDELSPSYR